MKKTILLFTCLLCCQQILKAQIDLGVTLMPQTTWLLNNNVSDQADNLDYNTSFGFLGGLHGAFFITKSIGIGGELNLNFFNQKYNGKQTEPFAVNYDITDHLQYFSIPLMLELRTSGGFYFELGPQFNFLMTAKQDYNRTSDTTPLDSSISGHSVKQGFNPSMIGGVFGFGGRFKLAGNLLMTAGLRFTGSFSDATQQLSESDFNTASTNGDLSTAVYYAHLDQQQNFSYQKTMAVSGGLVIGIVYSMGENKRQKKADQQEDKK